MIASSILNSITFKNVIGPALATPVNAAFTNGLGVLADDTYYYRVTALTADGETLPSAETSLAIAKLATPVNETFTAGAGTLPAATYYYRVSAINAVGETLASTETSLLLEAEGGVNVNWGVVTGATGYKIYGRSTGAELLIATVGAVTTYLDNGSLTPEGALPASNTTAGGINVNWTAVLGAPGYNVYGRSTGAELLIATVTGAITYLDDGSLTPEGTMPSANTTGISTYPNMWNSLHTDRVQGNNKIIPYYQKFPEDHVVYLQFESDSADDITLKCYHGTTELSSSTLSYDSDYGTGDVRYYTNFIVTLNSDYYDKKVYFMAMQGLERLTSEPVYIYDLSDEIAKGTIKYIKYTNLDRTESDLDDRFIDWSVLASTGNYLDFFVDAIDIDPNDTDESEVLEGSQSKTILSASFYSGRVLSTGGIPDYMVAKLGMASSLDIFMVNGIQYIKSGEIGQERFGGSTLYQASLKLTQKNAIGINVDNLGATVTETEPPVSGTPMYIGTVTAAIPTETQVKVISPIDAIKEDQIKEYTMSDARFCFAYPASFGALTSILDDSDDEIISGFNITTLDFTIGEDTISFKIYTLKSLATVTTHDVTYKF